MWYIFHKKQTGAKSTESIYLVQADILKHYSAIVKSGGKLVYATCSIFPSENEVQVNRFMGENPEFELEEKQTILPSQSGFDGFFMARLHRKK